MAGGEPVRRRRGSVLVYILVLTIAMATIVLTIVTFAGAQYTAVLHDEQASRAQTAFEGVNTTIRYNLANNLITLPNTTTYTIGSWSVPATVVDNNAAVTDTVSVSESASRFNRSFSKTFVMGNSLPVHDPTWWDYGVAMDQTGAFGDHCTTHGASTGDMWCNNTFTTPVNSTIAGNLKTGGASVPAHVTVQGTFSGNQTPKQWIRPKRNLYLGNADVVLNGDQVLNGYNFLTDYKLVYINGNLNFRGKWTKKGTFFVTGDITISDNSTGNSASDYCCFITAGTIHFIKNGTTNEGFYYAGVAISIEGDTTLNKGVAVARVINSQASDKFDVTWDNWANLNPTLATQMRIPGFWP
jgi:hypothetical protein